MTNKEAIEILGRMKSRINNDTFESALDLAIKSLEERPKGRWIYHKADGYFLPKMECSVCGAIDCLLDTTPKRFKQVYTHCWNCGANMKGTEE